MSNFDARADEIRRLRSVAEDYRRIARRKNGTTSLADWRAGLRMAERAERAEARLAEEMRRAESAARSSWLARVMAIIMAQPITQGQNHEQ